MTFQVAEVDGGSLQCYITRIQLRPNIHIHVYILLKSPAGLRGHESRLQVNICRTRVP